LDYSNTRMIAPDTQQNILYMIYFIVLHNTEALFYAAGITITTLLALYKPKRGLIIMMWGFAILLFAFEYNKHILEPLRQQTIDSLITVRESWRIEHTINYVLTRAVPKGLPILGWALIGLGLIFDRVFAMLFLNKKSIHS